MIFDFDTFARLATLEHKQSPYTLEHELFVFQYYFVRYEDAMHNPHPHIQRKQIARIMKSMPWIMQDNVGGYAADIDAADYKLVIDQHFRTKYRGCDYNINHFFSGKIRQLRWYEVCY